MGLVQHTAPRDTVLATAQEYARQLSETCSPASMAVIKRQILDGLRMPAAEAWRGRSPCGNPSPGLTSPRPWQPSGSAASRPSSRDDPRSLASWRPGRLLDWTPLLATGGVMAVWRPCRAPCAGRTEEVDDWSVRPTDRLPVGSGGRTTSRTGAGGVAVTAEPSHARPGGSTYGWASLRRRGLAGLCAQLRGRVGVRIGAHDLDTRALLVRPGVVLRRRDPLAHPCVCGRRGSHGGAPLGEWRVSAYTVAPGGEPEGRLQRAVALLCAWQERECRNPEQCGIGRGSAARNHGNEALARQHRVCTENPRGRLPPRVDHCRGMQRECLGVYRPRRSWGRWLGPGSNRRPIAFQADRSYQLSYPADEAFAETSAVLTGFEPAASTLTGWRALQTAPQDQASVRDSLAHGDACPQRDSNPCYRLERAAS